MDQRERPNVNRRWFRAFLLSVLFHMILFLFLIIGEVFAFLNKPRAAADNLKEIVFDLTPTEARMPREVIRSLSESETPPERPDFLSDRHSIARNDATAAASGNMPYFDGQTEFARMFEQARPSQNAGQTQPQPEASEGGEDAQQDGFRVSQKPASRSQNAFSREALLGMSSPNAADLPEPTYDNKNSSVTENGGISFNTYAWDFAPYMIKLKERLQRNLYPPSSFTRLGFGGDNLLKFRIYPDGSLQGPSVLQVRGDEALLATSKKSITLSAPFWPLPEEFPEDYLEVIVHYRYMGLTSP